MTRDRALQCVVGHQVMSPHSDPPYRPYRLSKVFLPATETGTPMCQIAALAPGEWLHLTAFEPGPAGQVWNARLSQWVDPPPKESRR